MDTLVRQAQNGDKDAFIKLIEENKLSMTRVAMTILANEEDAADAVGDTVLTVVEKLDTLKQAKFFKTWVHRILINHCYAILRGHKREYPSDVISESTYEQDMAQRMDVRDTLEGLHKNDRLILTLYYIEDISSKDIAQILGMNQNTVKTQIRRSRKRFINAYENREGKVNEVF